MKRLFPLFVMMLALSLCAEEVQHLKISGAFFCGGVRLGSRSMKLRHWFGSKSSYMEEVCEYGYKSDELTPMLYQNGHSYFQDWHRIQPSVLSVDGRTRRIYEVSGKLVIEGQQDIDCNVYECMKETAEHFREMFGVVLYTSPNPTSDRVDGRSWIGKFVDANNHTCYLHLFLRQTSSAATSSEQKQFQHYERECKSEIFVTVLDVNCASERNRSSWEHLYESLKKDATNPRDAKRLYKDVVGCIAILDDYKGGKSTGFLARANGQVYLYTSRHIPQPRLNQFADPDMSATTAEGKFVHLGRLQIPLFMGDGYDVARYELINNETVKAIDLDDEGEVNIGDRVWIFGNSGAGDVVTSIEGTILGVGPQKIEVDANLAQGSSGSPAFNGKGQVVGIVSNIQVSEKSVATESARYSQRRYFIARLNRLQLGFEPRGCWCRVGEDRNNEECSRRRTVESIKRLSRKKEAEIKYLQDTIDETKRQLNPALLSP